jgi:hypothetical protein
MWSLVLTWEIMAILEAGFDDATAVLALPEPYRRRLMFAVVGCGSSNHLAQLLLQFYRRA